MKISELTNKSFLGKSGVAANSYVLINYAEDENSAPVTYKATLQELGKAIANDQQLYKKGTNGAVTTSVSNNAYTENSEKISIIGRPVVVYDNEGGIGYYGAGSSILNPIDVGSTFDPTTYKNVDESNAALVFYIDSPFYFDDQGQRVPITFTPSEPGMIDLDGSTGYYALLSEDKLISWEDNQIKASYGYPVCYDPNSGTFGITINESFYTVNGLTINTL